MLGTKIKAYLDDNGIRYTHISEKTGIPMNVLSPMLNENSLFGIVYPVNKSQ